VRKLAPGKWAGRLNCPVMGYLPDTEGENKYPDG